ncbi:DUF4097 domain-containing protein [Mucilaginibacter sp. HMF5004]|uniref:DUF4097 domain-containing protein n=1 Tax=Mucilaginibacter rivuli TaxID=2857527 RepID=UPI001C5EF034|nr:DUF4097 domain-containing protein [Mucilaginibacter rivuli]MBW4891719.1 DUF4097 domain-containing protein [Mucilaginibacter rivuli]
MKRIVTLLTIIFGFTAAFGQTFQTTVNYNPKREQPLVESHLAKFHVKGKELIVIDVQEATANFEGYDGDDIVIEADPVASKPAVVLPGFSLASSGLLPSDNLVHYRVLTNEPGVFGLSLTIPYTTGLKFGHYKVLVPKNIKLKVVFVISELGAKMSFKNLSNGLEVEGTAPVITFDHISGPLTLSEGINGHRIGGTEKIIISHLQQSNAQFDSLEDTPLLNIITTHGDVDISLPQEAKATIQVDAGYGNLYSDLNMVKQRPAFPLVKSRYTGNVNGGGRMIVINAANGNVYLRKEK